MTSPKTPPSMQVEPALLIPPREPLWCVQMGEIVPETFNGVHESRWAPGTLCPHEHLPVLIAVPRRGMYPGMAEYEPAANGASAHPNKTTDKTTYNDAQEG